MANKLVQIRGTSGSGKSTVVRSIIARATRSREFYTPGRRRPLFTAHVLADPSGGEGIDLAVLGHYETECGGADTINTVGVTFELARALAAGERPHDIPLDAYPRRPMCVLFEGLIIYADLGRTKKLNEDTGGRLTVFAMDTAVEACVEGINDRRRRRMRDKYVPVNPTNTQTKHRGVVSCMRRLDEVGVSTAWISRQNGVDAVTRELFR